MKTLLLLGILLVTSTLTFGQSQKYQTVTSSIITNTKAKILSQSEDYVKTEYLAKYTLTDIQTICDTTAKAEKVSFNWRRNYDRNFEKEYIFNGMKLLITIYENDKIIYFEFPN
jgi:hypothetical protein